MNKTIDMRLKLSLFVFFGLSLVMPLFGQNLTIDQKVENLLKQMTLEEKIGQMNQYTSDWKATGPIKQDGNKQDMIRKGLVGSMLNVKGVEHTRTLQQIAMQSRLRIPLLFGLDVVHGYRTTFPIPLAEAATWDLAYIEKSARIAAKEASAAGIHWTFAPMVDIARDPRWGRVMEGAGEDPYLGSLIAAARVKGFQGDGLGSTGAIMACAKHYAAYGAAVGGRDYNSVDMSLRQLHQTYLPPFKAATEAGAATFMNSFNDLNGIPATGNIYLLRDILKGQWGFEGFVVSDWGSIGEMIPHGYASDDYHASMLAIKAGSDMDMESRCYINNLAKLVTDGKINVELIDDAVRRILKKKFELGLFDDPYKFCNEEIEKEQWNNKENIEFSREIAKRSIVLLKNERQLLPLKKSGTRIALIGPFVKSVRDNIGFWSFAWPDDSLRIVTLWEGVKSKLGSDKNMLYAQGCGITDTSRVGFKDALEASSKADVVIISVGEASNMSGEAKSRSNIHLPGVQEDLIKAIASTGKPIVVLINAGRPLVFNWTATNIPSILYTWWLGTEAGNAIADVLFGDYNPSGKLPITFPLSEGQIPIYYNHFNTGRPVIEDNDHLYKSAYIDLSIKPQFDFGFGLSYTTFKYGEIQLNKTLLSGDDHLEASVTVTNTGAYKGEEVVQLYIRDVAASVVRGVKELKGFKKIELMPGESKNITFNIIFEDLKFFDSDLKYDWEPGEFRIMIGGNSRDVMEKKIIWNK